MKGQFNLALFFLCSSVFGAGYLAGTYDGPDGGFTVIVGGICVFVIFQSITAMHELINEVAQDSISNLLVAYGINMNGHFLQPGREFREWIANSETNYSCPPLALVKDKHLLQKEIDNVTVGTTRKRRRKSRR